MNQPTTEIVNDGTPWFAIRLFTTRQREVNEALTEKGLECFIPMQHVDYLDRDGRRRHKLQPVVHNLIFVKKTLEQKDLRDIVTDFPYKVAVIRRNRETTEFYEIPSQQMHEFRVMCNPDLLVKQYLSEEQAKLKVGTLVNVTHGPLKGLSGKLVRQSHKYYLLKEVPGLAVMIKVTRWCCRPVAEEKG